MSDGNLMTPEDMDELMRSDEKFAAMLQKQFDEEESRMFNRDARSLSPDLIAHPASPIEDRLSTLADNALDAGFEERISAQLLKHINKSGPEQPSSSRFFQNGTSNGTDIHMSDQPSTSSSQHDDLLSEEYARHLQQEFDTESKFMCMGNNDNQEKWDPISEWRRTGDDDEALNQALKASLLDQPTSSKGDFYPNTTNEDSNFAQSSSSGDQLPNHSDQNEK